jgi:cytochrome c553
MKPAHNRFVGATALAAALLFATTQAPAGERRTGAPTDDRWLTECGSCHVAYPPRLLPARSWSAIIGGLERHFGSDVSLDASAAAAIRAFLMTNAGRDASPVGTPPLRITQTRWFAHEHGKLDAAVWKGEKVGSAANCGACHRDADTGRFSEHDVRIPR